MLHSRTALSGTSREYSMYGLELKKNPLAQGSQDPQSTDLCKNYFFSLTKEDTSKEISCLCLKKVNCYNPQGVLVLSVFGNDL